MFSFWYKKNARIQLPGYSYPNFDRGVYWQRMLMKMLKLQILPTTYLFHYIHLFQYYSIVTGLVLIIVSEHASRSFIFL